MTHFFGLSVRTSEWVKVVTYKNKESTQKQIKSSHTEFCTYVNRPIQHRSEKMTFDVGGQN